MKKPFRVTQQFDRHREYERCDALDMHGRRCRKRASVITHYHGASDVYPFSEDVPQWVRVALCLKHGKDL